MHSKGRGNGSSRKNKERVLEETVLVQAILEVLNVCFVYKPCRSLVSGVSGTPWIRTKYAQGEIKNPTKAGMRNLLQASAPPRTRARA